MISDFRSAVERAYGPKPYSTTRRARLYRKLFGHWPQRVVDERLYAVHMAELEAELRGRGVHADDLKLMFP